MSLYDVCMYVCMYNEGETMHSCTSSHTLNQNGLRNRQYNILVRDVVSVSRRVLERLGLVTLTSRS